MPTDRKANLEERLTLFNTSLPGDADADEKLDVKGIMKKLRQRGFVAPADFDDITLAHLEKADVPARIAERAAKDWGLESAAPAPKKTAGPTEFRLVTDADEVRKLDIPGLLKVYDHDNPGLVGAELDSRASGRPFLLFVGDVLDRKASADRLTLMVRGRPVAARQVIDGAPARPICVGAIRKEEPFQVNVLYPDRVLEEPGEVCSVTHEAWAPEGSEPILKGELRGILLLAVTETREIRRDLDPEAARAIIEKARTPGALAAFRIRYPKAAERWASLPKAQQPTCEILPSELARRGGAPPPPFSAGDDGEDAAADPPSRWPDDRRKALRAALLRAFPSLDKLVMMASDQKIHRNLDAITGGNLEKRAWELIEWMDANQGGDDGIDRLLAASIAQNPGNPSLKALATPPPKAIARLSEATIHAIHAAAITVGALDCFGGSGINATYVATLPEGNNPAATLLTRLFKMNETGALTDGSFPLAQWLRTAIQLSGPRTEIAPLRAALAQLTATPEPSGGSAVTKAALRDRIGRELRTDSDFNAFCIDWFGDVERRFTDGMDRTAKVNLLFTHATPEKVAAALDRR